MRTEQQIRLLELDQATAREENVSRVPAALHLATGTAYLHLERLAEAEAEFRAAVDKNESLGAAHNNLAVVYMLTGRLDQAERVLGAAERSGFPVDPRFRANLQARLAAR